MKQPEIGRRSKPPYKYTYQSGVLKKRSMLPITLYVLFVSLPMAVAIFIASLQVHSAQPLKTSKNLASTTKIDYAANQPQLNAPPASLTDQDSGLQAIINQFVASHTDHQWSVLAQGLGSDERSASYNARQNIESASIYKLFLMYPLMQKTPISQWGQVNVDLLGSNATLADCVTAMLKVSDNDCGQAVGNYVGWGYATTQLKSIGLEATNLNDLDGPTTTAGDTAYFLQGLYAGKWFDGATRNFILNILDQQIYRSGIPTGCGQGCNVADKTGNLDSVRHDAGIVRYNRGAYVLSIFTNGASYAQIAQLTGRIQAYMAN